MIQLIESLKDKDCKFMIKEYNIDVNDNYKFYLIYIY